MGSSRLNFRLPVEDRTDTFFQKPISAADALLFDEWIKIGLNIPLHGTGSVEFFPKQAKALVGNALRAPLGINLKPEAHGARGWFEGPTRDVIRQLEWLAEKPLNDSRGMVRLADLIRRQKLLEFVSVTTIKRRTGVNVFNIFNCVHSQRKQGNEWVAQCPVCAAEGHDKSKDNLHVLQDGSFICMFNQPGITHNQQAIIDAFFRRQG